VAVAVVVDAVARLGRRTGAAHAREAAADAGAYPRLAGALRRAAGLAAARVALVGHPVAVVVEVVADLRPTGDLVDADQRAADALHAPDVAHARAGSTDAPTLGVALVLLAVAVVVEAVADLGRRGHLAVADHATAGGVAAGRAHRALAGVDPAGDAALGIALVHQPVAVVVGAVAALDRRVGGH